MTKYPIGLVDCNNFYASCERVFNPKLRGKPIIVLSNNDGMIIARSNEAKAVGIKMGEPLFKVEELVKKHDVFVFSSNYALYGDMSHRVMRVLETFAPEVEIYSIDEAFLCFKGMEWQDLTEYCRKIRETVKKWTGIPVSIGIGETKTLAKIANRFAKKSTKCDGVLNLVNSPFIEKALERTEVSDVWGVGRQYTKFLNKHNIKNALELSQADDKWIRKNMTVMGLRTVFELRGTPCISIENSPPAKKAIISSRSFGKLVTTIQEIKEGVAVFTAKAAEKMRRQKSTATSMTVFIRTNPFKQESQYHNGVMVQFPVPTDITSEMLMYAQMGVDQIFKEGYRYQKVGVMLTGFVPFDRAQIGLFDIEDRVKRVKMTAVVDSINREMGANALFYGSMGIKRQWKTKSNKKSPRFTTSWKELPNVYAGQAEKTDEIIEEVALVNNFDDFEEDD